VSRAGVWRRGIKDFLMGYSALLAGAAGATVLMLALGVPLEDGSYLEAGILPSYWMQVTIPSVIISIVAGFAGAVLIANNRSILTAGVMIALSLVPTIAMAGMGLVRLDPWSSVRAAGIWLIDVAIVLAVSVLAFVWKRRAVQRRLMSA